nr:hypothetical protein [Tanacetum cinerariifolium]
MFTSLNLVFPLDAFRLVIKLQIIEDPNEPPTLKDPKFWTAEEKKTRKIDRLARSLLIQGLSNDIYSLIDSNKTAKDLWDALERQMRGSEYGEQDKKATILYKYETFKATEEEQLLDTYLHYLQVINDLKKCGYKKDNCDVNDALRYKKKAVVVTSYPLALVAEKTKVSKCKEKVEVQTESEGSDDEDINDLKKITALLAKAFNRKKYYAKPTNNNLRTSSASSSANKKPEYEINANMVFMAQIEKVILDSDESSSSAKETIAEVAYYTSKSKSESEYETSAYYDNSTNYGLFVNNDDDQEVFHDAIESASENFIENHNDSQNDYDKSEGNSQNIIDDKGYWDSGCSRHMTGNISYLSDYEPYDGGYVSFGQGGEKITSKECIVFGRDFKLKDDTNVLLRTPRQHNMYSIDLNNIVPHKDLTCLVAKASADESMLWHRRLGTKDAASQDVKKDVFSLRYIALPNYRNSNPTATSKNPPADQKETLTVESTIHTMDLKSAFLYGTIDEEVYVMQPPGFQDPEFPNRVYKVENATGTIDQTLFIRRYRGDFILVQVYVDDIIFGSSNPLLCREFEALMHDKFQMSGMGKLNFFFGLQFQQKKDGIFLSQDKYVGDILKMFGYSDVRSMIGSLMYLTASRPDIMFAVCACARHQVTPKECHLDYGGATQDRKSTTRGCQFFGRRLISWKCKKQTIVATSTIEAEYVVATSGCGQFWSTAKIEKTDEGTKILATVDGKPMTIFESSIRRNLKLNDEEGISILPDAELFENLALMGYNILLNHKFTFQKGQFSHQWKYLIHTIMQCLSPKSTGFNEFSSNIATAVGEGSGTPTEPHHTPSPKAQQSPHIYSPLPIHPTTSTDIIPTTTPTEIPTLRQYSRRATQIAQSKSLPTVADVSASPLGDDSQGEAFPTVSGLEAGQDRENIIKTSTLPRDSTRRVTSLATDEGIMQQQLHELIDLCTRLQRQKIEMASKITAQDLEISNLKERIKLLEDKEKGSAELSGDDAPIKGRNLETKKEAAVSVTPVDEIPIGCVPTGSSPVPTASPIFTTASVVTPYSRRKDGLDRSNEVIARHLHEYEHAAADLTIGEKIELINELVKYQDHHAKILKYQAQQSKPISKKQQIEFYMPFLKSHLGWKTKHFKGMTLEEIREKFIPVWKQIEDFVPMASKEEGERFKRKGLRLKQGSAKKMKTSEEVSEEDLKEMMQLVPVEEVYVEALQVKNPIIDWEIHTKEEIREKFIPVWKQIEDFVPMASKEEG